MLRNGPSLALTYMPILSESSLSKANKNVVTTFNDVATKINVFGACQKQQHLKIY